MMDLTVLLPVRDGADFIEGALTSIANQTLGSFTTLVLDDGSQDGTRSVVERFGRTDARFRLIRCEREGIVASLQRGLALVETEFLARMDADDISHPTRFEVQWSFLNDHPELAGCGAAVRYTPEALVTDHARAYQRWLNGMTSWELVERDLFVECPLAHPTFFFRSAPILEVGGYHDEGWAEDYDLLLRLWRAGHRFVSVPEVLLDWSIRGGRLSRSHPAYSLDAFRRCRVHHLAKTHLSDRDVFIWGAGPTGKAFARACMDGGIRIRGFAEVDPKKLGQEIYGLPVQPPAVVAAFEQAVHLGAVARKKARTSLRESALALGLEDGVNFLSVA